MHGAIDALDVEADAVDDEVADDEDDVADAWLADTLRRKSIHDGNFSSLSVVDPPPPNMYTNSC
jgi:hypothetical protein